MKTWKLTVNEDELKALIKYHMYNPFDDNDNSFTIERSARIHDLTKRLNKETPDVENASEGQAKVENQSVTTQW